MRGVFRNRWILQTLSVTVLTLAFAWPAFSRAVIALSDIAMVESRYEKLIMAEVVGVLAESGLQNEPAPVISVSVGFDTGRLEKDAASYYLDQQRQQDEYLNNLVTRKSQKADQKTEAGAVVTSDGTRFGRLNLDLNRAQMQEILTRPDPQEEAPLQLNYTVSRTVAPFVFDPMAYLRDMSVKIILPAAAPAALDDSVRTRVTAAVEKTGFKPTADWLTVERMKPVEVKEPGVNEWLQSLVAPRNNAIIILIGCIVVGVFMLIATMMLASVFTKVARSIGELKPAAETGTGKETGEEAQAEAAATTEESVDLEAASDDGRNRFDPGAVAQALTSEMRTIRSQLEEIAQSSPQVMGELLSDLFYEKRGMEDLRDLLSFAGYKALKPGMDLLPERMLGRLQNFIEESRKEPVSLLSGVEVAQRLYRDCISRMSGAADGMPAVDKFRSSLISTEDEVILQLLASLQPVELAQVLKYMSLERGTAFMRRVPMEALKAATLCLDEVPANLDQVLTGLTAKMAAVAGSETGSSSSQLRFVLRLAQQAGVDDEEGVLGLFPAGDVSFSLAVMRKKFFFAYVKFLPAEFLRSILDGVDLKSRAEFLYVAGDELKNRVLGTYKDGSKLKEMLVNELDLIGKNAKLQEGLAKRRVQVIEQVMKHIRHKVADNDAILQQVVQAQTGAAGASSGSQETNQDTKTAQTAA